LHSSRVSYGRKQQTCAHLADMIGGDSLKSVRMTLSV
jgi:hypothetical protein